MTEFIKIAISIFLMACIVWFISFQLNPNSVCKEHSDPKLRKDYYECNPGGFALEKGTILERDPDHHFLWEQDMQFMKVPVKEKDKKRNKENNIKTDWICSDDFYLLTDEQLKEININDYCHKKNKQNKNVDTSPVMEL